VARKKKTTKKAGRSPAKAPAEPVSAPLLTTDELVEALGVTRTTVDRYVAEGCPIEEPAGGRKGRGRPNKFSIEAVRAWMHSRGIDGKPGRPSAVDKVAARLGKLLASEMSGGDGELDLDMVKVRKLFAEAVLREMDVEKRRGELLEASEVEQGRLDRIYAVKSAMDALPARLAPRLVGLEEPDLEAVLREAMRGLQATFAGDES
jgi:phage terminase Nu1 subunit (DNA packaging protein)